MVQFSSLFNALAKNISNRPAKNNGFDVSRKTACALAKEAKKNELVLTSCGVLNAYKSKNFAAAYSRKGKKGPNQDCFIVWKEFGCQEDMIFCGVFDGHGPWGHLVAKTVRDMMPPSLLCNWQEAVNSVSLENGFGSDSNCILQSDIWRQCFLDTCAIVDKELENHPGIDSFYSGSTGLTLVRQGDLLTIANIGDSRAVLATTSDDGSLVPIQLTNDLKPNLPYESKRIAQSRGRVHSCPDEPGVYRVWKPNGPELNGPGLAISRAFGDYFIKDFGLISEPEITQRNVTSRDQFVILATDGVWDVLSNKEAVEIVKSNRERAESAKRLVECAICAWKRRGRATKMDDISAICLFFHHSNFPQSVNNITKLNQKIV